jgi:hypothetical protein
LRLVLWLLHLVHLAWNARGLYEARVARAAEALTVTLARH